MSEEYDNEMRGVLFKNNRKETERHPDYKGSAQIDGVEYWISGWIKTPRRGGNKFMSLAFTAKEAEFQKGSGDNKMSNDYDDDVPF